MIEGLKPYADYRDSGHRWLGKLPAHWKVLPNRALFDERKERNQSDAAMLSVTITRGIVPQRALLSESSKKDSSNADKSAYKLVVPGDIVYNKMRAWQGALGASQLRGIVSPAYVVLKPRAGVRADYYHHLLRTSAFSKEAERWSYGITSDMWSLRPEHFKLIGSPLPPPDEQAAIFRFLDHANRKIDRFIRAKRKLIALLNEQKQAIIQRSVVGRRDKDVAVKASELDWLGDIPAHWDQPLLGRCLLGIEQGWSPVAAEGELVPGQWCVLTLSSIRSGSFVPGAVKPVSLHAQIPHDIEIADGDLLLTRSNTRDRVGDVCVVRGSRPHTLLCDLIYRLRPISNLIEPQYLAYQLLSQIGRRQIESDARGSSGTMPKISQSHIRAWRVLVPPIAEQRAIVSAIEAESAPLSAAMLRTQREISLMQEYQTRLTADIVTGKLDVREAAAKLPELADAPVDESIIDEPDEALELEATE